MQSRALATMDSFAGAIYGVAPLAMSARPIDGESSFALCLCSILPFAELAALRRLAVIDRAQSLTHFRKNA